MNVWESARGHDAALAVMTIAKELRRMNELKAQELELLKKINHIEDNEGK